MRTMPSLDLTLEDQSRLTDLVETVLANCPGQTEFRYLSYARQQLDVRGELPFVDAAFTASGGDPVHVRNLPQFDDVEKSKILCLLLGEAIGTCVAYAEYNHSYITDIRPTTLSSEKSSGTDLLSMHNDLAWASDNCRPRTLVLVPHVAAGEVPKTLLAPARDVLAVLSEDTKDALRLRHFEARSGSALSWGHERVRRMELLVEEEGKPPVIRLNFGTYTPAAGLDGSERERASKALTELSRAALEVGRQYGISILKGESVLIPNDHCVHGRDTIQPGKCERLLLRSYVLPDAIAARHGNSMVQLSS
ncbi:TauD/TfdA family dioxygenase [Streptomyces sp. NBC_00335]|uniref:TauD/TfdA family dioxygenase n=1 Tax=unclassified Streptomyces TaxID=2593676 RepID=UPI00225A9F78|nr:MULTISPECIES: TauD/TfdA family dioxygenase [unclassified Streptomyces]MCX5406825.1 TauD/TfdA family dioxygenase [Streptomyces sp. NBC_00086]